MFKKVIKSQCFVRSFSYTKTCRIIQIGKPLFPKRNVKYQEQSKPIVQHEQSERDEYYGINEMLISSSLETKPNSNEEESNMYILSNADIDLYDDRDENTPLYVPKDHPIEEFEEWYTISESKVDPSGSEEKPYRWNAIQKENELRQAIVNYMKERN